jgi:regulator of protease activity HflC (stomatin/prohibitin superfamily)
MTTALVVAVVVALLGAAFVSCKVVREYERAVVFRLGRVLPIKGPGLVVLIPLVDRMVRVDLRTVTLTIPPQEVITRDNVPARVAAVCYFRVVDPGAAITAIEAFAPATSQIAQTTLRSVLGRADLDELLAERERLNEDLQKIIDEQTEPWGIKVSIVEIKDVEIPEVMQRAMARQAEAERERRAKIINAEGEYQAAEKLAAAAAIIAREPSALQLRYLQTLLEIGAEQNSTIVFPLPLDLLAPFLARATTEGAAAERSGSAAGPPPTTAWHDPAGGDAAGQ